MIKVIDNNTFPGMFDNIPRNVWQYSPECLVIFPRMFQDIPRNVRLRFPECFAIFPGFLATFPGMLAISLQMFKDIPRNVWRHFPECLATFHGMFGDISRNITFPHSQRSPHSAPRSCFPGFIYSRCSRLHLLIRT